MAKSNSDEPTREGLDAQVTRAIPNIIVEVLPGNSASHQGKPHAEGDTFEVEGPTAIALVQAGHVKIVGSVEP